MIGAYGSMVPSALVIYDHIITLHAEVSLIWAGKKTWVSIVFLLNRYTILAWSILTSILYSSLYGDGQSVCNPILQIWFLCRIMWGCVWAASVALRVYAVSGRRRLLTLMTLTFGLMDPAINTFSMIQYSLFCLQDELNSSNVNAHQQATTEYLLCARAGLIASDIVLLYVTWSNMLQVTRFGERTDQRMLSLSKLLLKNGTGYFLFLLVLSILQIVLWVTVSLQRRCGMKSRPATTRILRFLLIKTTRFICRHSSAPWAHFPNMNLK
ncbi:hypothetical protein WOLCODRAFT_27281 [Wolfiporia cocos MD-104 SS10]|uniref:DUF6533 domain-containing protein n=1 Tax=Wolfiporia cocos (strain MD-104) TaxID=742152 RepID=A0A2H3JEY6_WOLCO|nr:hypothetical protein WOLCODRAFT_27281 [Wolfiporia cocos MD-104 SS10]